MTGRQQAGVAAVVVAMVIGGLLVGRQLFGRELHPVGTGESAPNFSARALGTRAVRTKALTDYKGHVVLLNIWATWCAPCRAEMPSIEQLHREFGPRGLRVVAVNIDDGSDDRGIQTFMKQYGLTFDILHDTAGTIQQTYQTTGVPESFLIGKDGVIRKKVDGAVDWNSENTHRLVERLISE